MAAMVCAPLNKTERVHAANVPLRFSDSQDLVRDSAELRGHRTWVFRCHGFADSFKQRQRRDELQNVYGGAHYLL